MSLDNPTRQEIYEDKAEQRKISAKQPFSVKWETMIRMQWMAYQIKKSSGRKPSRPWTMPLADYEAEWGIEE